MPGGFRRHASYPPIISFLAATAHLATFNLTAFVFIVQEYGRKHVGELAEGQGEGQGEWQGEWQGGLYSIVQE